MPFTVDDTPFGSLSVSLADVDSTLAASIMATAPATLSLNVGTPGPGVPVGGTTGQVLKKVSGTDYDTAWQTDLNTGVWGSITGTLSNQTDLQTALNLKADLASPALTGVPTAPTAATLTSTTQIATTAFVQQELAAGTAVAKNLEVYVRNQTGASLPAGTIVYINGSTGNRPTVTKAQANNDANSAQTFGFTKTSIADNGFGYVIVRGELENIDTSALTEGTQLYLSPSTAGTWTTTKPSAPQHLVYVGIVVRAHPTQGVILVAIQNGYELYELHDVKITTPTDGQVLKYDSAQSLWVNGTDVGGVAWGGITGTLSNQTDLQNALNAKLNSSSPSATGDLTITGSFTLLTASSGTLRYSHSTLPEYSELTRESLTLFADTSDKSVEITNAGLRLYDPAAGAAATITFSDSSVQDTAFIPANYLTASTISSTYAPLSSPALTGNPTAPTPATSDNDTSIATTAFVKAQGYLTSAPVTSVAGKTGAVTLTNTDISGLGTMATETASNYLTTATASSTYAPLASPTFTGTVTIPAGASISGFAPLASPALTGTPTAPTAAAATNTTQIATTAFVQTSNPSASTTTSGHIQLATDAQAKTGTSATLASTPYRTNLQIINPSALEWATFNSATSGAGAANLLYGSLVYEQDSPNASVAGYATLHSNTQMGWVNGGSTNRLTFNKPVLISGKITKATGFAGDANNAFRVYLGSTDIGGAPNGGDPAGPAIGLKFIGGASQVFQLMVHDGTTLRFVNGTTTIATNTVYEWMVYSDGAGNATLFINGTQEATSANAPTGTSNTTYLVQAISQTASAATRLVLINRNTKVIVGT